MVRASQVARPAQLEVCRWDSEARPDSDSDWMITIMRVWRSGRLVTWIVATTDIGVFTDIGDKMTRYRVTCHDNGFFV